MKKKLLQSLFLLAIGVVLVGCGSSTKEPADDSGDKIKIMTTFYPMYEFTKQVAGDEAEVELMIPAGTEPHDFEPSAKDIVKINDAAAFVYNSDELETWVRDITNDLDKEKTAVIEASSGIKLMEGVEEDHEGAADHDHELDPHVWLSPALAVQEVEKIQKALSKKFPDQSSVFEKNAQNYIAKLNDLDKEYETALANAAQRDFVTQHAAFGYLAREYDLTQVPISGLSPDEEPSASRLAELKEYVAKNDINYIYFEENTNSKVAETLAKEANVKTLVLNPLESLSEKQIKAGEDYISVMQDNLKALQKTIQ